MPPLLRPSHEPPEPYSAHPYSGSLRLCAEVTDWQKGGSGSRGVWVLRPKIAKSRRDLPVSEEPGAASPPLGE